MTPDLEVLELNLAPLLRRDCTAEAAAAALRTQIAPERLPSGAPLPDEPLASALSGSRSSSPERESCLAAEAQLRAIASTT